MLSERNSIALDMPGSYAVCVPIVSWQEIRELGRYREPLVTIALTAVRLPGFDLACALPPHGKLSVWECNVGKMLPVKVQHCSGKRLDCDGAASPHAITVGIRERAPRLVVRATVLNTMGDRIRSTVKIGHVRKYEQTLCQS